MYNMHQTAEPYSAVILQSTLQFEAVNGGFYMDPRSKKLLTLLENDCTLTHAQLAAMCDTTVEDIEMRIKSLTDEGVILGYKAMVNWEKTSVEAVEALIEVKITPAG